MPLEVRGRVIQASAHLGEEGNGGDLEESAQAEWAGKKILGAPQAGAMDSVAEGVSSFSSFKWYG